ncbi:MAG TPA: hypothetical protein VJ787_09125 [Thermoleophilia bacterium]|nr:hypothetical protein [Thermoleophilia bacterium]
MPSLKQPPAREGLTTKAVLLGLVQFIVLMIVINLLLQVVLRLVVSEDRMQAAFHSGNLALVAFAVTAAIFLWRSLRRRAARQRRL